MCGKRERRRTDDEKATVALLRECGGEKWCDEKVKEGEGEILKKSEGAFGSLNLAGYFIGPEAISTDKCRTLPRLIV